VAWSGINIMSRIIKSQPYFRLLTLCSIVAGAAFASLSALPAHAVPPNPVAFTLSMGPYARTLNALEEFGPMSQQFMDISMEDGWDNPHQRVRARNKPAIMIVNENQSVAPLTSFMLTINDPGPFFFGTGDFATDSFTGFIQNTIYTDPGVSITGSSLSPDGKTLTVNFNGLVANSKAIFNVDLDTSDPSLFPFPDYRLVLCAPPNGSNGSNGTSSMGATISATFTDASSPPPNTTTLTDTLPPAASEPEFFEHVIRPAKLMEMVEHKDVFVPEPSALILAFSGLGLAAIQRRRAAH
jgi:hypothetical protein